MKYFYPVLPRRPGKRGKRVVALYWVLPPSSTLAPLLGTRKVSQLLEIPCFFRAPSDSKIEELSAKTQKTSDSFPDLYCASVSPQDARRFKLRAPAGAQPTPLPQSRKVALPHSIQLLCEETRCPVVKAGTIHLPKTILLVNIKDQVPYLTRGARGRVWKSRRVKGRRFRASMGRLTAKSERHFLRNSCSSVPFVCRIRFWECKIGSPS